METTNSLNVYGTSVYEKVITSNQWGKKSINKYGSILKQIHKIRVGLICQATV